MYRILSISLFLLACGAPLGLSILPIGGERIAHHEPCTKKKAYCLCDKLGEDVAPPNAEALQAAIEARATAAALGEGWDKDLLTFIDFDLPSTEPRLWVFDLDSEELLYCTHVAHGKHSGGLWARNFSNVPQSYQSSLGLFATGEVYTGKHGLSLYLEGLEEDVNDKARERYIVMHGADYVSEAFAKMHGRMGRSLGCPAIPEEDVAEIIPLIAGGSCLYIHHSSRLGAALSEAQ